MRIKEPISELPFATVRRGRYTDIVVEVIRIAGKSWLPIEFDSEFEAKIGANNIRVAILKKYGRSAETSRSPDGKTLFVRLRGES